LGEADGPDRPTLCKCDLISAAVRSDLTQHKGHITKARQAPLVRTMIAAHGWAAVLKQTFPSHRSVFCSHAKDNFMLQLCLTSQAAIELREAFGVRPACWRCGKV
jgi:hypothetical protein